MRAVGTAAAGAAVLGVQGGWPMSRVHVTGGLLGRQKCFQSMVDATCIGRGTTPVCNSTSFGPAMNFSCLFARLCLFAARRRVLSLLMWPWREGERDTERDRETETHRDRERQIEKERGGRGTDSESEGRRVLRNLTQSRAPALVVYAKRELSFDVLFTPAGAGSRFQLGAD